MNITPERKRILGLFLATYRPLLDTEITTATPATARVQIHKLRHGFGLELPLTKFGAKSYAATDADRLKIEKLLGGHGG